MVFRHVGILMYLPRTDLHWAHDTSCELSSAVHTQNSVLITSFHDYTDYEQQRKDLLRKHGIDLADGGTTKTKRMSKKMVDEIMGNEPGGIFTWRDRNRKKVISAVDLCRTPIVNSPIHLQLAYSV